MNFARDVVEAAPPERLAMVELARGGARREWRFGEVAERAGLLHAHLAAHGARRGDVVLTLLGNRPEWVLTLVACFRAGYAVLPCTEQLRPKDLRMRLAVTEPTLVVADERNRDVLDAAGWTGPTVWAPWAGLPNRDVLMDRHPIFWISNPWYIGVSALAAVVTWLWIRKFPPPDRALQYADALGLAFFSIAGAQIAEAGGLAPFAATFANIHDIVPSARLFGAFAFLVLAGSILAYLLWFHLLNVCGATAASAYHFLMPPLGMLFAYLVLGEHVELRDLLGIIPVALGIYLVTRPAASAARRN